MAAKALYQRTGNQTWSKRSSALFEEKEALEVGVLDDICMRK